MSVALIVAVAANGMIGRDNALPWHIPADLKWFKRQTLGKPVIMGRRTWDSLGRPLPGRTNIVLTRQPGWSAEGALVAASLDAALALAEQAAPGAEAMVIGGATLYAEALPCAGRIYLTEIGSAYDGDTSFPPFDRTAWREVSREPQAGDPPFAFVVLERVAPPQPAC
ncbi:dihydrofolate reductase [Phaeospirillum tilakii]|uniref:Dihydrofolate reductase n=1 Tax=Phaeospirillum tilakii TaxID=741673 RepID=A0ABW5C799_9PROT